MKVLFDISHAGQVHFFKNTMKMLESKGIDYITVIKEKDSVVRLLDEHGIEYTSLGRYASNFDKMKKIPAFTRKIRQLIRQNDVTKVMGVHPIHGSLATKGLDVTAIGFSDTDHAIEQMVLYWPFCDEIYTSYAFRHKFGTSQKFYRGFHELAYLHPDHFTPSKSGIEELFEEGPPVLYRMINWDATHDLSFRNYKQRETNLILKLADKFPVILSAEGSYPKKLGHLVKEYPASRLHDILYYSSLYVGAGATTAIESSVLGTPAIYTNPLSAGVLDFLNSNYILFNQFPSYLEEQSKFFKMVDNYQNMKNAQQVRKHLIRQCIDVKELVDAIVLNEEQKINRLLSNKNREL